jgi:hypothetical protein
MIVTLLYWWLKAIYLFILSCKSWWQPLPNEVLERKRERRAVRKLFPGISQKKSLTFFLFPVKPKMVLNMLYMVLYIIEKLSSCSFLMAPTFMPFGPFTRY